MSQNSRFHLEKNKIRIKLANPRYNLERFHHT